MKNFKLTKKMAIITYMTGFFFLNNAIAKRDFQPMSTLVDELRHTPNLYHVEQLKLMREHDVPLNGRGFDIYSLSKTGDVSTVKGARGYQSIDGRPKWRYFDEDFCVDKHGKHRFVDSEISRFIPYRRYKFGDTDVVDVKIRAKNGGDWVLRFYLTDEDENPHFNPFYTPDTIKQILDKEIPDYQIFDALKTSKAQSRNPDELKSHVSQITLDGGWKIELDEEAATEILDTQRGDLDYSRLRVTIQLVTDFTDCPYPFDMYSVLGKDGTLTAESLLGVNRLDNNFIEYSRADQKWKVNVKLRIFCKEINLKLVAPTTHHIEDALSPSSNEVFIRPIKHSEFYPMPIMEEETSSIMINPIVPTLTSSEDEEDSLTHQETESRVDEGPVLKITPNNDFQSFFEEPSSDLRIVPIKF